MSEARNSAVTFLNSGSVSSQTRCQGHTQRLLGVDSRSSVPSLSRVGFSVTSPTTVLRAPHESTASLRSTWVESFLWVSYLGHRDLVSISPQVTQHLGSQSLLLLVADSSGRDWMSLEDLSVMLA